MQFLVKISPTVGEICYEEGCFGSFPACTRSLRRRRITVRAQDVLGNVFELETDGLLAITNASVNVLRAVRPRTCAGRVFAARDGRATA